MEDHKENIEDNSDFSKNSIIVLSRKAGIKTISQCGINKVKYLMNNKIKELSENLYAFYRANNTKTLTKKMVNDFLESEGIYMTHNTHNDD
jgi:hypothetical protein